MNAKQCHALASAVLAAAAWSTIGLGQQLAAENAAGVDAEYYGAKTCVACHRTAEQSNYAQQVSGHILLDEYTTWRYKDKHSLAYCVLDGDLSRRMGELLGYDDVTKDKRCTSCHAPQHERTHLDGAPHAAEGVSCETCHGPAAKWYGPHQFDTWRGVPAEKKRDEYGMTNLEDPVTRSALCTSCHVGGGEGRIVTHAMYAAGHPPLPSVEIGYYSDAMPRHWRYEHEKQRTAAGGAAAVERDFERTKLVLVGAAVSLGAAADSIAHQTADENGWPELAQFDCAACHHDLKYPSWRQERGYAGRPGRPTPRLSPLPVVQLSALLAGRGDDELEAAILPVYAAFDARPFGDPPAIQAASERLKGWSDDIVTALSTTDFDEAAAQSALRQLCDIAVARTPDYDAARQIAWAMKMIYSDLHPDERNWHPQAASIFGQLDSQLRLTFPPRATADQEPDDPPRPANEPDRMCADVPPEGPIIMTLPAALKTMPTYDPDAFQAAVAEFARLLDSP